MPPFDAPPSRLPRPMTVAQARPVESPGHHALRGIVHTLFLAACGAGFWGAMIAGEYAGFKPVSTGLILFWMMMYIALVKDVPNDPPEPLDPEAQARQRWVVDGESPRMGPARETAREATGMAEAPSQDEGPHKPA